MVKFIILENLYKDIFNNLVKKKDKKKTIIVGDNLDTDILGGKKYKIKTALALDGYKKLNLIKSDNLAIKEILKNKIKPDYIIKRYIYILKKTLNIFSKLRGSSL